MSQYEPRRCHTASSNWLRIMRNQEKLWVSGSQQVAIAPHKHMPIATYSNGYIELDAGLSASTGGEHPNISQAQHRQRRLPVCASRLTAVEHPTTLRSTTEAPAR